MKTNLIISIFFLISQFSTSQNLTVQNPSFEGNSGIGITPAPWEICMNGQTPDTQPGWFDVNIAPSDGATYLGLATDHFTDWQEGASQELLNATTLNPEPMQAGETYNLTIDLRGFPVVGGTYTDEAELLIYGGFMTCPQNELLWSSGDTPDDDWNTYNISLNPSNNYTYIMLQIESTNPSPQFSGAYLLVDNMSNIQKGCPEPEANAGLDQEICENFINLSANPPTNSVDGGIMTGEWSIISGSGQFNSISDPNALVSNLSNGENIFEWTLTNDCGTSSSLVVINYDLEFEIQIPNNVNCLNSFELFSSGEGNWIVNDPLNLIIDDSSSPNTFATPQSYGTYIISFEACGNIVYSQEVSIIGSIPIISGPTTSTCLDPISLNVSVPGDPGFWSYDGPGQATFDNILSLNPTISVDTYGIYNFTYYGCGLSNSFVVNFLTENPTIETPDITYCSFETTLTAFSQNPEGWSLYSSPNNSNVEILNPQSETTEIEVSNYGLYQFMFEGCGGSEIVDVLFEAIEPSIIYPVYEDCSKETTLSAYTQINEIGGPWEQIGGPADAVIENPFALTTNIIVPEYGVYEFIYPSCDTYSTIQIGFSCTPNFPNVMSPNNDGNNDEFVIENLSNGNYEESLLTIINRWGRVVYLEKDYGLSDESKWWDGKTTYNVKQFSGISSDRNIESITKKEVSEGVYFYVFEVFNKARKINEKFTGYITIIR